MHCSALQEENKLARTAATLLIRTPKPSLCKMQPGQLLDDAVCQSATHGHKEVSLAYLMRPLVCKRLWMAHTPSLDGPTASQQAASIRFNHHLNDAVHLCRVQSPSSSAAAQDLASQLAASVSLGQEPPSALASTPRAQRIASWQPPKPPRSTSLTTAAPSAPAEVPRAESPVQHRRGRQSRSGNVGWERSSAPMPHMRSTPLDVTRQSVQDILKHDQTILSTLQPIRTSASALGKALKPGEQITSCPQLALPAATAARHSAGAAATSLSASTTTGQIPLPELGLGAVPEVESAAALLAQRLAAAEQQVLQRRMSSLRSAAYAPDAFNAFLTTAAPVRTDAAAYPTTKFTDTQQCAAGAIGKKLSIKMFPSPSQGPLDITVDASAAAQAQAHMPGTARASGGQGAYAMLASVDSADVAACDAPLRSSPFACQAVTPSDSCFSSPECFSATNTATASTPASRAVPGSGQLDGVWSSAAQSTAAGPSLLELHSGMVSNDDLLAVEEPFTPTAAAAAAASASAAQMLRAFERQMVAAGRNGSE